MHRFFKKLAIEISAWLIDVLDISVIYSRVAQVDDVLCSKCYSLLRLYRSSLNRTEVENQEVNPAPAQASPLSTQTSTQTSSSSQPSDPNDSTITYPDETSPETVELPIRRTVATHKYWFLCRGSENLVQVSFEARFYVFRRHQIFIPKGT